MRRRQTYFNLQCCEVREGLSAMLDGAADENETAALQAHLQECDDCSAYDKELRNLHARLRAELTDSCSADQIWERVEWAIASQDTSPAANMSVVQAKRRLQGSSVQRWAGAALAAMLLIGVMFGGQTFLRTDANNLPVVTETIRDFETFRLRGGMLDVAAREPNVVRGWMAARIEFELPVNVNPPVGFKLAGGRLCSFLNRRLAFFYYEKGPAALSLYVMKASGLKLPDDGSFDVATSGKRLTTVAWADAGLAFVVVSSLPASEVTAIASRLMHRAPVPEGTQL